MLDPLHIPGLFVTGTDTGVGKTLIAGAIADYFHRRERVVSVLKPVATGCVRRREGLVSEDAEFLAVCSCTRHPLDLICPCRYAEPLAPSVAARRANQPLEWEAIQRSIRIMSAGAAAMIVEGAGGVMTPVDDQHLMIDIVKMLSVPAVVVSPAALGAINHTVLTVRALQSAGIVVAGVIVNRYPAESPGVAEETNPREIERWAGVPILAIVPEESAMTRTLAAGKISSGVSSAISRVDWSTLLQTAARPLG